LETPNVRSSRHILSMVPFIFVDSKKCWFCGRHGVASFHNRNCLYLSVVVFYNKYLIPSNVPGLYRRPPTSVLVIIIFEALISFKLRDDSFHWYWSKKKWKWECLYKLVSNGLNMKHSGYFTIIDILGKRYKVCVGSPVIIQYIL